MSTENEGLVVEKDPYGGMILKTSAQKFESADEFDRRLGEAVSRWKESGVRGLWIKVSIQQAHWVQVCTKHGLDFHHAQPGYVMMACWLPDEESRIPEYANHYLGVGGFVVNDQNQVLVIQEKFYPGSTIPRWKLPGGHANKGEEIADVAIREVFEETGIETTFVSVIAFRHQTQYRYGCSDFYFICLLRPLTSDIKKCQHEIANCQWMDIEDYVNDPDITDANRFFAEHYRDNVVRDKLVILPTPVNSLSQKRTHLIYSIKPLPDSTAIKHPL